MDIILSCYPCQVIFGFSNIIIYLLFFILKLNLEGNIKNKNYNKNLSKLYLVI